MNLIVDRGNTHAKFALFNGDKLVSTTICDRISDAFLQQFTAMNHIDAAIYCSVAGNDEPFLAILRRFVPNLHVMPFDLAFPISFDYDLHQLGVDRIAAAVGARKLVSEGDLLVVDAGSCVTYDIVNAQNHFECGNIAPGYEMRLRAMHQFTAKLPLLKPVEPQQFIAAETEQAMLAGAFNGIVFEIESYFRHFQQQNRHFQLILTGGTSILLQNKINFCTFAEPNLVLIGLNEILTNNQ